MAVGSRNPVKIKSSEQALELIFKEEECLVEGCDVPSGVRDQPYGDEETLQGAKNRAKYAFDAYRDHHNMSPRYSIGLEGGVKARESKLECFAWCAVYNGSTYGTARSAAFYLPKAIADLMESGMELGDADDRVFGSLNAKQAEGTIGHLTKGIISRGDYYRPIVTLAFVPFMWPDLYLN